MQSHLHEVCSSGGVTFTSLHAPPETSALMTIGKGVTTAVLFLHGKTLTHWNYIYNRTLLLKALPFSCFTLNKALNPWPYVRKNSALPHPLFYEVHSWQWFNMCNSKTPHTIIFEL